MSDKLDIRLTPSQQRVVRLLADGATIFINSKQEWKVTRAPLLMFKRSEISSLIASRIAAVFYPSAIARPHLRLTKAGQDVAARLKLERESNGK